MEQENKGISIVELLSVLLNRWWAILIGVVIGVGLSYALAFHVIKPKYKATTEVLLQVKTPSGEFSSLETQRMIATVSDFMKSDMVAEDVVDSLSGNNLSPKTIQNGLQVKSSTTSFFLKLSYVSADRDLATVVVNQIAQSAYNLANSTTSTVLKDSFIITSEAKEASYTSPNKSLYLMSGFMLGAIVGAIVVLLFEFGRFTYRNAEEIENDLNVQVIGTIAEFEIRGGTQ